MNTLSKEDAKKYLNNYLRVERDAVAKMIPQIEKSTQGQVYTLYISEYLLIS